MKKYIITLLCLAIIAGGSFAAYKQVQKNKDENRVAEVYPVSALSESWWGDEKTFDGTVTSGSIQEVTLSSDKLVKKVCVNAGDRVKKGDTLLEYDMTIVELETEQKKNQVALVEQDIADAEKELARLKTLQPSELKPQTLSQPDTYEPEQEYEEPGDNEDETDESVEGEFDDSSESFDDDSAELDESLDESETDLSDDESSVSTTSSRSRVTVSSETSASSIAESNNGSLSAQDSDNDTQLDSLTDRDISETDTSSTETLTSAAGDVSVSDNNISSEDTPAETDPEDEGSQEDKPDYSIYEDENGMLTDILSAEQTAGKESDGALAFRCTMNTRVSAAFMQEIILQRAHAVLYVFDDSGEKLLYFWDIDAAVNGSLAVYDWVAGNGVVSSRGMLSYDGSAAGRCGLFFVYTSDEEPDIPNDNSDDVPVDDADSSVSDNVSSVDLADDSELDLGDDSDGGFSLDDGDDTALDLEETDKFDFTKDDFKNDDDSSTAVNENYMYTRTELAKKIQEKESDIKDLQLSLKTAKLEYQTSLKRKESGKVVAQIDGVVTKCGAETANAEDEEYLYADNIDGDFDFSENSGDDFLLDDESDSSAYIIVMGNEGVSIEINVGELHLDDFSAGTEVNVTSLYNGESFTANVTGVKDEPYSYKSNWDDNPNSSIYRVTADVADDPAVSIGSDVIVSLGEINEYEKDMICLPMSYVHKEGSGYYVMKQGKDGLLTKQHIVSGKNFYGSYLEIKGGLTMDDFIAFPYGKTAKEGTKTQESDMPEYY